MNFINLEDFQQRDFKHDYRLRALLKFIPKSKGKILDIGSGNGEIAISLSREAKVIYATDKSEILLKKLQEKTRNIPNIIIKKIDAEDFRLKDKFDLIIACDIVEHLKNDTTFFLNCYNHLNQNGRLFISVPAKMILYGIKDRNFGHYRRYEKDEIINKIKQAGFSVPRFQYWNFIGFFPYLVVERIFKKALVGPARHQLSSVFSKIINKFLYLWLVLEGKFRFLPVGLSLIILAKKR